MSTAAPGVSIVIVSLNTRDILRKCLHTVQRELDAAPHIQAEIFVVDNNSSDGSPAMLREEFPQVELIVSAINLGFAGANNVAMRIARGRYIVLLNSDAFFQPNALRLAVEHMDATPKAGLGGARLIGEDGSWQPSARIFPTPLHEMLMHTGLAAKYPKSKFFGRADRTWADPLQPASTDWVPGAFMIIRKTVLDQVGLFDENFFLYYEETDLCRRIRNAGHQVWYWPDIVVIHIGGESTRQSGHVVIGSQLTLWRMRAMLLYFRKYHGSLGVRIMRTLEGAYYRLRAWRNRHSRHPEALQRAASNTALLAALQQAWRETAGGRISPPRPW
jgi:GT2 family glycosyltransferase